MTINWLILHHSAVSRTKNPDQFIANNEYHRKKWNFKSSYGYYLGYHYEISAAGIIKQARSESEEGAHTIGRNQDSIGICLDGNFDIEMPTDEQIKSLTELLKELHERYPKAQIVPHRKFANKSCYGKLLSDDWANNLISNKMKLKKYGGDIYLTEDTLKFSWNIPDVPALIQINDHFKKIGKPLNEEPEAFDPTTEGYYVVHGGSKLSLREFFNI